MSNGQGSDIPDSSWLASSMPPMARAGVPPNIGLAPAWAQTVGLLESIIQGLRAGHVQRQMRDYDSVSHRYMMARANYDALGREIEASKGRVSQDQLDHLLRAQEDAFRGMQQGYDQLINFGAPAKGKGGKTGGQGGGDDPHSTAMQKIGRVLERVLLGQQSQRPHMDVYTPPPRQTTATPSPPQLPSFGGGSMGTSPLG